MSRTLTTTATMAFDDALPGWVSHLNIVPVESANAEESPGQRRTRWMVAAQAGDRRVYEKLLADSIALFRTAARRRGVARDHLDDVVQETLITVHRVRHTFDPARSYDAWLNAIASRRAIDALRSSGRRDRRELHDEFALERQPAGDDASAGAERAQRAQRLRAAVDRLPPGQREAVEQLGLRERSLDEAAELTGRGTGALKVNLHRALQALRKHFHGEP
jgi:RNA polymerase sigma-70 factor (ECF subfamily)